MIRISYTFPLPAAVVFSIAFAAFSPIANAHSDFFLTEVSGQAAIGGANELGTINEDFDLTTQVFEGVMIPNFPPFGPADYGRDEPGFFALSSGSTAFPAGASALPDSASVSINFVPITIGGHTDSLFYWNGSGGVDFQPISLAQPGAAMSLDPNPIATTGATGSLHDHAAFKLDNGTAGVPADGVYLVAPSLSVASLSDSSPAFMLWLVDALLVDEDAAEGLETLLEMGQTTYLGKDLAFFETAVSHVEESFVPEPAVGAVSVAMLVGLVTSVRFRRNDRVNAEA
jgi:hypothetical protein